MGYFQKIPDIIKSHREIYGYDNLDILQKSFNEMGAYKESPFKIHPNSRNTFFLLIEKVQQKITELENQLETASKKERDDLEARLEELCAALEEFQVIENSEHIYSFEIGDEPLFKMELDDLNGSIVYDGTLGSLINELKHAFQYETGKIDFLRVQNGSTTTVYPGLLYDTTDELETYKRQYALDGILTLKIALSKEKVYEQVLQAKELSDIGKVVIKKMSDVKLKVVAKISDYALKEGLYKTISQKPLDRNSEMGDILKGNKKRKVVKNHLSFLDVDEEQPYFEYVKVFVNERVYIDVKN